MLVWAFSYCIKQVQKTRRYWKPWFFYAKTGILLEVKCWLKGTITWQLETLTYSKLAQLRHQRSTGSPCRSMKMYAVWKLRITYMGVRKKETWVLVLPSWLEASDFSSTGQSFLSYTMRACLISESLCCHDILEIITLAKANFDSEHLEQTEIGVWISSWHCEMNVPLTVTHGHQDLL